MLMVPPALFLITFKNDWKKVIIISVLLSCGFIVSRGSSYFSFGPYKQSVEYLHKTYPEVHKVFHVIEVTVGPFVEYSPVEIENYWFNPKKTIVFTNMAVFHNLHTTASLDNVLNKDESFCVASFPNLSFNTNNLKEILAKSQLLKIDTIVDNKVGHGSKIVLFILKLQKPSLNSSRINLF